jgi:anti-sigma factor RsiW
MNPRAPLDPRLLEALSAYLDGKLEGAERSSLEGRLKRGEALRAQLEELRAVRESLRSLPALKPPRPLTLSPAQAGASARRPGAITSRRMAFASALAALAFVAMTSLDVFSRASLVGGAAAPQAMPVAESVRSSDGAEAGAEQTLQEPLPAMNPTHMESATGARAAPTGISSPTAPPPAKGECYANPGDSNAADRCGLTNGPVPSPTPGLAALPDFPTAAPYLEGFLGLSAVLLAVLAFVFRKRG